MADLAAVRFAIHTVLSSVREAASAMSRPYSRSVPTFHLLSSLAEGSDRLAAEAALALDYQLHCPLPLSQDSYARDFDGDASREEFRSLIERATDVFVVQDHAAASGVPDESREAAYERAGRYVVQFSDLLLTVWDGEELRGRGGTAQMVDAAIDRGLPIAWIPLDDPRRIRIRTRDGESDDPEAVARIVRSVLDGT